MRKIKDVLRLKLDARLSHQQIAAALGISKGVVAKYVGLAAAAGLDWAAVQDIDETALERRLLVILPSDLAIMFSRTTAVCIRNCDAKA
jgi:predicted transcriptional regulator